MNLNDEKLPGNVLLFLHCYIDPPASIMLQ